METRAQLQGLGVIGTTRSRLSVRPSTMHGTSRSPRCGPQIRAEPRQPVSSAKVTSRGQQQMPHPANPAGTGC